MDNGLEMKSSNTWLGIIAFIIVLLLSRQNPDKRTNALCDEKQRMKYEEFNAVVQRKFLDQKNHNYRALELKNFKNGKIQTIYLINESSNFYQIVNENDTIIKEKDSFKILIKNTNTFHKLSYPCN